MALSRLFQGGSGTRSPILLLFGVLLLCPFFWSPRSTLPSHVLVAGDSSQYETPYSLTTDGPDSLKEGKRLFGESDYDRAALFFWRAVLFHGNHADAYTVEDAFQSFMNCYAIQDRPVDGLVFIAQESFSRNQLPMAQQYLGQALSMDPTHEEALALQQKIAEGGSGSAAGTSPNLIKKEPKPRENKFQAAYGSSEASNPLAGKSPEDLYEYGSTLFSRRNYEHCADVFELSCKRSNFQLGPACSNAVYCRMMILDWGFNGTGFDKDMHRMQEMTEVEARNWRQGDDKNFQWHRAASAHPHMMLGYPLPPKLKRYVAEASSFMDEKMARVTEKGQVAPLPDDLPFQPKADMSKYVEEASQPDFKLKVGFISSGFNSKAVLFLSQDIFRFYDRQKVEMHILSLGPPDNENFIKFGMRGVDWRERVAGHVDKFHDLQDIKSNHIEMARYIHDLGIHILIEWDGFARQGERAQGLMGLRPAPVQILHQEYLGTSGATFVDYIFTDRITSPQHLEHLYTEKFIYMPNHFFSKGHAVQAEVALPAVEHTRANVPHKLGSGSPEENRCMASGIKKPSFVFCNFNKFLKNNPETMRSWLQILREVPGSILCLLENPETGVNYLKRFIHETSGEPTTFRDTRSGKNVPDFIPKDGDDLARRVHFLPWEKNPFDHQQRNRDFCNVMLDSHPYNGHTVAQDALYAGVPIITRSDGDDMSSRVSTSANVVLGLDVLNAHNGPSQYEEIAIDLGNNRTLFDDVRNRLISSALQRNPMHPYWDAHRYTKNLETGWFMAWDRFLSGLEPDHLEIVESQVASRGTYDDVLEAMPSDPPRTGHSEL